jgi:hypothetical protein
MALRRAEYRRHLYPDKLSGMRGDKIRDRLGSPAAKLVLDLVQCMVDQIAFHDCKNRAAQADQHAVGPTLHAIPRRLEQLARPAVVEQDAAVQIANNYAL